MLTSITAININTFKFEVANQIKKVCTKHSEHYDYIQYSSPHESRWVGCCTSCREEAHIAQIKAITLKNQLTYQQGLIAKLFNQAAIPPRFAGSTFDSYIADTLAKQEVKRTLQQFATNIDANLKLGRNLILAGNVGNGKSHLSVAVAKSAIDKGRTALFTTVGEMIDKINAGDWHKGKVIDKYAVPDLLVLDEVTCGFNSVEQAHLFKVLNRRYELMKSTMILTNLSVEDLPEILGVRIFDRLRDNGGMVVHFTWDSFRK